VDYDHVLPILPIGTSSRRFAVRPRGRSGGERTGAGGGDRRASAAWHLHHPSVRMPLG